MSAFNLLKWLAGDPAINRAGKSVTYRKKSSKEGGFVAFCDMTTYRVDSDGHHSPISGQLNTSYDLVCMAADLVEKVVGGFTPRATLVPEMEPCCQGDRVEQAMVVKGTKTGRAPYKLWWEIQDTKESNLRSKNAALHREIRAMLGDPS